MSTTELARLVETAGFVFRGRVLRRNTSDSRLAADARSIIAQVEEVLRSTDVLRGFAGREVIVLTDKADEIEPGSILVFFTNCVVLADYVVVEEVGSMRSSSEATRQLTETVRAAEEAPLLRRIAGAELVIHGQSLSSERAETPALPVSEHDPEWWIARVRVVGVMKGRRVREVQVLFANSTDVAWYRSPKLHEGTNGVLLLRRENPDISAPERARGMYQATDPLDLLPVDRLEEVRRLVGQEGRIQ